MSSNFVEAIAKGQNVTIEELQAELARTKAENERLKAGKPLSLKIGEKGGLSVYGLGRFPVTLYKSQWLRLIAFIETIKKFIEENEDKLKDKEAA